MPPRMSEQTEKQKSDRVAIACLTCRFRKVRCSGGNPCKLCSKLATECEYPPKQRRKPTKKIRDVHYVADETAISSAQEEREASVPEGHSILHSRKQPRGPQDSDTRPAGAARTISVARSASPTRNLTESVNQTLTTTWPATAQIRRDDASVWLSPCINAGIAWVCEKTGEQSFAKVAERFTRIAEELFPTRPCTFPTPTSAEPTEATAWEYVNAFFENCWEARLGFVHRPDFEAQLQAHFYGASSSSTDCAALALRNVIFAAGYRSILAKRPEISFTAAQKIVWQGYFQNALSVLTGLLLPPSRLMAVQALALMACYVEGLGSLGIQRVLCHNAVHAAITQGLHLDSTQPIDNSPNERLKRAWLWWSIYAFEKHHSITNGRPSMIDDYIISVPVPREVPPGSVVDVEATEIAIRLAKTCSRLLREILSTKAWGIPARELQKAVMDTDKQLKALLDSLPLDLRVGTLAKLSEATYPTARRIYAFYLHFSIHGSLLAIHAQFSYPWLSARLAGHLPDTTLDAQSALSSAIAAEAARNILLAIRTVTSNVATPTWLAFNYPVYAHLGLFIHVLRYPNLPTASADLGVLDICAGHFGHIDFMTSSELSVSLPRESVHLAAKVVKAFQLGQDQLASLNHDHEDQSADLQTRPEGTHGSKHSQSLTATSSTSQGHLPQISSVGWNALRSYDTMGINDHTHDDF
ncbi:hypothetical protein LTR84_002693 [Exophiala bonariae]|uniref:Zn(2)-C6 fungal-type domain-containing protein n=1 Tax=Exophiala bonariae TaxID=1690606 RepID=A0AAV9NAU3_9EURO|nr:hypothetical protein LTR84_002693 [Exophiala bonariae]